LGYREWKLSDIEVSNANCTFGYQEKKSDKATKQVMTKETEKLMALLPWIGDALFLPFFFLFLIAMTKLASFQQWTVRTALLYTRQG